MHQDGHCKFKMKRKPIVWNHFHKLEHTESSQTDFKKAQQYMSITKLIKKEIKRLKEDF